MYCPEQLDEGLIVSNLQGGLSAETSPLSAESSPDTTVRLVEEADGYMTEVAGIEIQSIRTGAGDGPNVVLATQGQGFIATAVTAGFPMLGRTNMRDDQVVMAVVEAAPPGSNWCGVDLEEGMVVCWPPATEHTAVNPVGIEFAFVATSCGELAVRSEHLGAQFVPPPRGRFRALAPTAESRFFGRTLSAMVQAAAAGVDPDRNREDDILGAMTLALSDPHRARPAGPRRTRRIDSRTVVHTCIAYIEAIGRIPSFGELCLVAHVCERRLRDAFTEVYGITPNRFFRTWALNDARLRLVNADPSGDTVTRIAADLGIGHVGRFAARYKSVYQESPSETLARTR
jgi:AraC family ethanolamine operon transcriptional activator